MQIWPSAPWRAVSDGNKKGDEEFFSQGIDGLKMIILFV